MLYCPAFGPVDQLSLPSAGGAFMDSMNHWGTLTPEEKNHQLYLKQKELLDTFLQHGAITPAQHDKSLHDLQDKMHEA